MKRYFMKFSVLIFPQSISPGPVETDMLRTVLSVDRNTFPMLQDVDIANAVVYTLGTPDGVEVRINRCKNSFKNENFS